MGGRVQGCSHPEGRPARTSVALWSGCGGHRRGPALQDHCGVHGAGCRTGLASKRCACRLASRLQTLNRPPRGRGRSIFRGLPSSTLLHLGPLLQCNPKSLEEPELCPGGGTWSVSSASTEICKTHGT